MGANLDAYRIFSVVGRTQSFSAAARELYITQSAVSQAIRQLEQQLDCALFYRRSRGVVPTREGKMLLEYVGSALGLLQAGEERLEQMKQLLWGELKIAAGDTVAKNFLLKYLETFSAKYPAIKLQMVNRTTRQSIRMLKSGGVEIVVGNLPIEDEDIQVIPCRSVQDIFVASQRYAQLRGRRISRKELLEYPLILLEPLANSRRYVDRCFLKDGFTIHPVIELGAYDLLLDFARIHLGISCVIREFSVQALSQGDLFEIQLEDPLPPRQIGICTLRGVTLSHAAQRFVELVSADRIAPSSEL